MDQKKFPWFDIYWDENDVKAVEMIIRRGSYWAAGPEIKEFEDKLSNYFGVNYAIALNSGTSALHVLLLAYGITSGEVIVPSFSFISTVNCVVLAGATPIFADIEKQSLGLDYNDVLEKITDRTKAIIPMHYGGKICKDIKKLKEICDQKGIILIEDNAESFGAKLDGKLTGTFGNAAILSFCQNKIITTGEGGAIITNSKDIYEKSKLLRSHGRAEDDKVNYFESINFMDYIDIGYNYRLPTMAAALGISQLEKIDTILKIRREKGQYYNLKLCEIEGITIIPDLKNGESSFQFYAFLVKNKSIRNSLQKYLVERHVFSKVQFEPIHYKSSFKNKFNTSKGSLPITEEISNRIISIPFSLKFSDADQDYIVNLIRKFFESNNG